MRSVYDAVKLSTAIRPTSVSAVGTPVAAAVLAVDTFGYNSALLNVATGSPTGSACSYVVSLQVQECATSDGTYADIAGATGTITGTTTTTNLLAQVRVEGLGTSRKRYLKITALVTPTPTTSVVPISSTAVLGRGYKVPVGNSATG